MKRTWPIIGVSNVQVSSEWYAANNHPGDPTFDQVWPRTALFSSVFIIGAITVILR